MSNRRPNPGTLTPATPRVVHYVDPRPAPVQLYTPAQLEHKRREERALYARWVERQERIAESDRRFRRFWLGFGAVVGTATLGGLAALAWATYRWVTDSAFGIVALVAVVLAAVVVTPLGRRCITIVQHWH